MALPELFSHLTVAGIRAGAALPKLVGEFVSSSLLAALRPPCSGRLNHPERHKYQKRHPVSKEPSSGKETHQRASL
jgi:hypothetical protein